MVFFTLPSQKEPSPHPLLPPRILRRRLDNAMQQLMAKVRADDEEDDDVDSGGIDHHGVEDVAFSKVIVRVVVRV
ncbi:hypothetical protein HBI56_074740 [Parastagonospora nodorum]|nr:hypothetical protein HBI05_043770 [Parastagonospora nodorum]KAH4365943.1 hypothetical protein HBH97_168130 [Parastagonospora nodorum]KAH4392228.1 hypothetical protein HBH99_149120 [Parastagonospora nodorum]KAH4946316.1 hypothetical protein HBH74_052920 [Parastagonospora nodorum]KAH4958041.1 hypothetical protein HBH73_085490 [Parastagonospora nodorum]